jgi:hypothetical protein
MIMNSKLIIVEGIPGSGKTTTAKNIRDWMVNKGLKPLLYLEDTTYHPVDLDNLSYLDEKQYQHFVEEFIEYLNVIEQISERIDRGYFIHYQRWSDITGEKMPDEIAEALYAHNAHDTLHPVKYRELLVERWRRFSARSKNSEEITIFECSFLQTPLTVFIGKHNYEFNEVKSLIYELAEIIHELNPVLVFLRGESTRETIQRVAKERPLAWIQFVEAYITGQGYGKAHKLRGKEGIFAFYEMVQGIEEEMFSQLDWSKLRVDHTIWNWEQHNQEIEDFLEEVYRSAASPKSPSN